MKLFSFYTRLMRPEQWVKNGFIFLALFFGQRFDDWNRLQCCLIAFIGFCLIASSIYCLNDIFDIEADQNHPEKKHRPLARGDVSKSSAFMFALLLFIMGFSIFLLGKVALGVTFIALLYFIMNIAYSLKLKHYAIVDVFIISIGFVLRVIIGGFASNIELSHWIIIMTFLLSLFLAFAKRRDDVLILNETGIKSRRNIIRYNLYFLNSVLAITGTIVIIAYIMYSVSPDVINRFHNDYLYITSIFVITGIFRYLQLTMVDEKSSNPTNILLKDQFIQFCIFGWIGLLIYIIYF